MRPERRVEIQRIKAEGAAAARNGKHNQTNPYPIHSSDWLQWAVGYSDQIEDMKPDGADQQS